MIYYFVLVVMLMNEDWIFDYIEFVNVFVVEYGGKYLVCMVSYECFEGEGIDVVLCIVIEWFLKEVVFVFMKDECYVFYFEV